jgi:hypothetical protein
VAFFAYMREFYTERVWCPHRRLERTATGAHDEKAISFDC